jgi:predicted dehydrogenase
MKFGIIGCGLIGQKRALAALACGASVSIVSDLDASRAEALAKRTGATATVHWKDALSADVEAIVVAVTHDLLAEMTFAAIESGKHVIVEKPAGRSASELAPVVAAARLHKRVVKVGYNHRFHPALIKARELFDSGEIGPIMYIRGRYGHGGRIGYDNEWRCKPSLSGGGELIDQGSHLIDLSRWFLGDVSLAYAYTPTYFWDIAVDDNCFLALKAQAGQLAWLHASWSEWKNMFSLEIAGRDGKLTIDGLGGSYGLERLTFHKMLAEMGPPQTTIWEYPFADSSWDAEMREFLAAVEEGRQPLGNIEDAYAVLKVVDDAYGRGSP